MSQDQPPQQQKQQQKPQKPQKQNAKRKPDDNAQSKPPVLHFTARNPPWTYLKLQLVNHQPSTQTQSQRDTPLDPLTTRTYLTAALSQFLGLVGTSISIDILKTPSSSSPGSTSLSASATSASASASASARHEDNTVWIRVPRPDAAAVVAALSSWVGSTGGSGNANAGVAWRVCGKGNFLGALVAGDGRDLFVP